MIVPTKQDQIADWAPVYGIARTACTRLLSIMNSSRPDGCYGLFDMNGIKLFQRVISEWAPDPRGSKIAAMLWSHEWQLIWDTTGVFVDGDIEAFDRDMTFISMVDPTELDQAASFVRVDGLV